MKNNWLNYYKYYVFFSRSGVWVINKYRIFDDMFNSYWFKSKSKTKTKKNTHWNTKKRPIDIYISNYRSSRDELSNLKDFYKLFDEWCKNGKNGNNVYQEL